MSGIRLLIVAVALTACARPNSSDEYKVNFNSCPQAQVLPQTKFQKKVQLSQGRTDSEILLLGQKISAGTRLLATYKKDCVASDIGSVTYRDFVLETDTRIEELEKEAQSDPCLLKVTESFHYRLTGNFSKPHGDPKLSQQKHLNALNARSAFEVFYDNSTGVQDTMVIAIVDSGVDLEHPDLAANIWKNEREIPSNGKDDDSNGYVDDIEGWNFVSEKNDPRPFPMNGILDGHVAHGTHIAGLAAAAWNNGEGGTGVMGKNVKIMAINVFGGSLDADTPKVASGIRYAADNGADVINLSLGSCGSDQALMDAILYAICKGATVVVSAGNNGRELSDDVSDARNACEPHSIGNPTAKYFGTPASFGASIRGLITVGSSDAISSNSNEYSRSDFSVWSPRLVEIFAPGNQQNSIGLLSTMPMDHSKQPLYGRMSGTSMAAPLVAGAVALAKSYSLRKGVALNPMELEELLESSTRREQRLEKYSKNGGHLDLRKLAERINFIFDSSNPSEELSINFAKVRPRR